MNKSSYTAEQVNRAINAGADVVIHAMDLSDQEVDIVNLTANAIGTMLDDPKADLLAVIQENWGEDGGSWRHDERLPQSVTDHLAPGDEDN